MFGFNLDGNSDKNKKNSCCERFVKQNIYTMCQNSLKKHIQGILYAVMGVLLSLMDRQYLFEIKFDVWKKSKNIKSSFVAGSFWITVLRFLGTLYEF